MIDCKCHKLFSVFACGNIDGSNSARAKSYIAVEAFESDHCAGEHVWIDPSTAKFAALITHYLLCKSIAFSALAHFPLR